MLGFLIKKKISEEKLADRFVTGILHLVDQGFPEVAALINDDPEFEHRPELTPKVVDRFLFIVLAGNLAYIPKHFNNYQDVRLMDSILNKLAIALNVDRDKLKQTVSAYQSYMSRINHPSKNIHYAMSKAVFFKYELNDFQEEYFRNMKAPNPLFLKRLDDIMDNFIWNWKEIQEKYKIVE